MKDKKNSFITNPTKKHIIIFGLLWFIGITLLTLSITDLFTESFFQKNYVMIYFLMIGSTMTTGKLYYNYWKNRTLKSHS
ncbi:hypothetical protein RRF68_04880 [Tenacibaculum sp. HL-MS23]|uniref:hypothetical protein n=1 Tax=Tenacibaculum sp. HL-MS23 TaxID=3077734 RepID=UPI0028FC103F|nr:hypothetical protein [Tenacibaculum sp. HL-MS23]WNW02747.1 hypothetical protein RRF68_04880 [Tenacibaculum sp. HL-MS23]